MAGWYFRSISEDEMMKSAVERLQAMGMF